MYLFIFYFHCSINIIMNIFTFFYLDLLNMMCQMELILNVQHLSNASRCKDPDRRFNWTDPADVHGWVFSPKHPVVEVFKVQFFSNCCQIYVSYTQAQFVWGSYVSFGLIGHEWLFLWAQTDFFVCFFTFLLFLLLIIIIITLAVCFHIVSACFFLPVKLFSFFLKTQNIKECSKEWLCSQPHGHYGVKISLNWTQWNYHSNLQ